MAAILMSKVERLPFWRRSSTRLTPKQRNGQTMPAAEIACSLPVMLRSIRLAAAHDPTARSNTSPILQSGIQCLRQNRVYNVSAMSSLWSVVPFVKILSALWRAATVSS
jgi:hypothetical protein